MRAATRAIPPNPTPPTSAKRSGVNETGILVLIQLLFGFSYVSSKVMVTALPVMVWVSLRTWITASAVAMLALILRGAPPRLKKGDGIQLVALAVIGASFNQATFLLGLERTTAANSAVLSCLIPVFTLLFSILLRREQWSLRVGLSLVCAFLGALIVVDFTQFNLAAKHLQGDLLIILNALSYGAFLAFGGSFLSRYDRLWGTAYLFAVGGIFLGIGAIPDWMQVTWPVFDAWLWGHSIYAVVGATLVPYVLINSVLVRVAPSKVALFVFLQPVVAGLSGWLVLGTPLTARWAIGSLFVFGGVLLSHLGSLRAAAARSIS